MQTELTQHEAMGPYWRMRLAAPALAQAYKPGQFIMVSARIGAAGSDFDPLLRRPFGLYDVNKAEGWIDVLYEVRGRGTRIMNSWQPGQSVDVTGPFGQPFGLPESVQTYLIVGGGVGIPPLLTVAHELSLRTPRPTIHLLLGARTGEHAVYRDIPGMDIQIAPDDGSKGIKGLVTVLVEQELAKIGKTSEVKNSETSEVTSPADVMIVTCGPTAMMKAVAALAQAANVPCEVSLEEHMACGFGACLGCAYRASDGSYKLACIDGSVVNSTDVVF